MAGLDGTSGTSSGPPAKRRKLTVEEKDKHRAEKELRARQREERRVQKEAENAVKEEERRVKAEKRRQEAEVKEEKQRAKDLAKKQKEEDEAKKQRAQLRLGSFFIKAAPTKTNDAPHSQHQECENSEVERPETSVSTQASPSKESRPRRQSEVEYADYRSFFLPFALPSHATLPPDPYSMASSSEIEQSLQLFDEALKSAVNCRTESLSSILGIAKPPRRGRLPTPAVIVIERMQESRFQAIDVTGDNTAKETRDPAADLADIHMKHLHFCEDVRPPYTGSYTKITTSSMAWKVARNPVSRVREDTNYDYDSEAEWEEPEEGEDLLSDGEDEAESVGSADEMEGFVDDGDVEDTLKAGRRLITSELEPVSSGVCWEGQTRAKATPESCPGDLDLGSMRLEWLIETSSKSINPLSDSYWQVKVAQPPPATDVFARLISSPSAASGSVMKPPRAPLQPASNSVNQKVIVNVKSGEKGPIMAIISSKNSKSAAAQLTGADFDRFKEAVDGSNVTKIELLKALKQRFPQFTNDSIKETLTNNFVRHGGSAAEKRWKLVSTA